MRIAVVTSPRTGSTFCLSLISNLLNLKNYEEILNKMICRSTDGNYIALNGDRSNESILNQLLNTDDYVVKIIASELFKRNLENAFPWNIFDTIILLERDNIFEQIISWYTLNHWERCIRKDVRKTYYVTDNFIRFAIYRIKKYHIVKDLITKNTNVSIVVKKENISEEISKIFGKRITDTVMVDSRKKLSSECDINGMNYNVVMNTQNVKERVLNILEKELEWNE
jgi:hypothetical protein